MSSTKRRPFCSNLCEFQCNFDVHNLGTHRKNIAKMEPHYEYITLSYTLRWGILFVNYFTSHGFWSKHHWHLVFFSALCVTDRNTVNSAVVGGFRNFNMWKKGKWVGRLQCYITDINYWKQQISCLVNIMFIKYGQSYDIRAPDYHEFYMSKSMLIR